MKKEFAGFSCLPIDSSMGPWRTSLCLAALASGLLHSKNKNNLNPVLSVLHLPLTPQCMERGFSGREGAHNIVNTKPPPCFAEVWAQGQDESGGPGLHYQKVQESVQRPCWWHAPDRSHIVFYPRNPAGTEGCPDNQRNSTLVRQSF